MGRWEDIIQALKPITLMIIVQFALAGVSVMYKLAASIGMSLRVVVAYRFMFAVAVTVPLAFFLDRKSKHKITKTTLWHAFLCAMFGGSLSQNLFAESLILTTATFSSAISNLVPAITFVIAVLLRFEKLQLRTVAGKAKVLGTLIGLGGAMILTFFKGPELNIWKANINLLPRNQHNGSHMPSSHNSLDADHILGSLLAIACCISVALALIYQAKMIRNYPLIYSSTALITCMGAIQSTIFALCVERDWNMWKLGLNLKLLVVAYGGIIGLGLTTLLMILSVRIKGPVFVSIFNPVMPIIVAIFSSLCLNEILRLGSVIGSATIIVGLYMVIWGKSKEIKIDQPVISKSGSIESEHFEVPRNSLVEANVNALCSANYMIGDDSALDSLPDQRSSIALENRRSSASVIPVTEDGATFDNGKRGRSSAAATIVSVTEHDVIIDLVTVSDQEQEVDIKKLDDQKPRKS